MVLCKFVFGRSNQVRSLVEESTTIVMMPRGRPTAKGVVLNLDHYFDDAMRASLLKAPPMPQLTPPAIALQTTMTPSSNSNGNSNGTTASVVQQPPSITPAIATPPPSVLTTIVPVAAAHNGFLFPLAVLRPDVEDALLFLDLLVSALPACEAYRGTTPLSRSCSARACYAPGVRDAPRRCREHALYDWRHALRPMCVEPTCQQPARYGVAWFRPTLCVAHHHQLPQPARGRTRFLCINVCIVCRGRAKPARWGISPLKFAIYCGRCRKQLPENQQRRLVDVSGARCEINDGSCNGIYGTCRSESIYKDWRTPSYGQAGCKAVRCETHMRVGADVYVASLRHCVEPHCHKGALFAPRMTPPRRCSAHRLEGDVNVRTIDVCTWCRVWSTSGTFRAECQVCVMQLNIRRECKMVRALVAAGGALARFSWNEDLMGATFTSRKPDAYYVFPGCRVLVECDEDQHKTTAYREDDPLRNEELIDALERSGTAATEIVFVRYNPDKFDVRGAAGKVEVPVRLATLVRLVQWLSRVGVGRVLHEWTRLAQQQFDVDHVTYQLVATRDPESLLLSHWHRFQLYFDRPSAGK